MDQESFKFISERKSTQILDFLGDIGGFKEAILLMLVTFGEYFSAKFFISKVAQDIYIRKKTPGKSPNMVNLQKDYQNEGGESMFKLASKKPDLEG
jgi:hypothetical protein